MRRIKKKEFKNGIRYCTYCKSEGKMKEHAIYRRSTTDLACELHKPIMAKAQAKEDRLEGLGESEGEYQARQIYERLF